MPINEGTLLWEPSTGTKEQANISTYMRWLEQHKGLHFADTEELWDWSVNHLEDFWTSLWEYFHIQSSKPYTEVLTGKQMPDMHWFTGAELNYVERVFSNRTNERPALIAQSEARPPIEMSWDELYRSTAAVAASLRKMGVQRGDRVVSYMPNIPETLIAFLAAASLGAIWSSCAPEFGVQSVIDRFQQIEPKVLFAVDGYRYNGIIADLQAALPTLQHTVVLPFATEGLRADDYKNYVLWSEIVSGEHELACEQVPFEHPLWILYSSGTTGLPKAIVQGHGGILLELLHALI